MSIWIDDRNRVLDFPMQTLLGNLLRLIPQETQSRGNFPLEVNRYEFQETFGTDWFFRLIIESGVHVTERFVGYQHHLHLDFALDMPCQVGHPAFEDVLSRGYWRLKTLYSVVNIPPMFTCYPNTSLSIFWGI